MLNLISYKMKILLILFIVSIPLFSGAENLSKSTKKSPIEFPEVSVFNETGNGFRRTLLFSNYESPEFTGRTINRSNFDRNLLTTTDLTILPLTSSSSAYQFQKVEKRALMSIGLILIGIPLMVVGIGNDETAILTIGATSVLAGATIAVAGHYQVIGPGYVMKKDKITLTSASHGFGLALNF